MGRASPFFISKDQAFLPYFLTFIGWVFPILKGLASYYILNLNNKCTNFHE